MKELKGCLPSDPTNSNARSFVSIESDICRNYHSLRMSSSFVDLWSELIKQLGHITNRHFIKRSLTSSSMVSSHQIYRLDLLYPQRQLPSNVTMPTLSTMPLDMYVETFTSQYINRLNQTKLNCFAVLRLC